MCIYILGDIALNKNELLRNLPSVDSLLLSKKGRELVQSHGHKRVSACVKELLDDIRRNILAGAEDIDFEIMPLIEKELSRERGIRRVINATGILLHTNLGRAPMAEEAVQAVVRASMGYSNLEFNLEDGKRGSRLDGLNEVLRKLFNVEAALAVNNNAAAVLLMLSSLARDKEVVVSRGELVEIGGSFRIPEVMEQSGAHLREVGATNKTHAFDYERAINENTAAILKVHTSNYSIRGFTEQVDIAGLREIADRNNIPLLYDIGSGAILSLAKYGLSDEPLVKKSLKEGADVVCFSGDKLLCASQAGIVVGKAEYIEKMKRHPLYRALRLDKMCLAALEKSLELYLDEEHAEKRLPLYAMLSLSEEELKKRADKLAKRLFVKGVDAVSLRLSGLCGGGSCPDEEIPSYGVAIKSENPDADLKALRSLEMPIIARIQEDRIVFDLRTVSEQELIILFEEILLVFA